MSERALLNQFVGRAVLRIDANGLASIIFPATPPLLTLTQWSDNFVIFGELVALSMLNYYVCS